MKLNKSQESKLLSFSTTSCQIRYLIKIGFHPKDDRGPMSRLLTKLTGKQVSYQWVNNEVNRTAKTRKENC